MFLLLVFMVFASLSPVKAGDATCGDINIYVTDPTQDGDTKTITLIILHHESRIATVKCNTQQQWDCSTNFNLATTSMDSPSDDWGIQKRLLIDIIHSRSNGEAVGDFTRCLHAVATEIWSHLGDFPPLIEAKGP